MNWALAATSTSEASSLLLHRGSTYSPTAAGRWDDEWARAVAAGSSSAPHAAHKPWWQAPLDDLGHHGMKKESTVMAVILKPDFLKMPSIDVFDPQGLESAYYVSIF